MVASVDANQMVAAADKTNCLSRKCADVLFKSDDYNFEI
jgi:hypothetical protein